MDHNIALYIYAKNILFKVAGVEISVGNLAKIVILPLRFEKSGILPEMSV